MIGKVRSRDAGEVIDYTLSLMLDQRVFSGFHLRVSWSSEMSADQLYVTGKLLGWQCPSCINSKSGFKRPGYRE